MESIDNAGNVIKYDVYDWAVAFDLPYDIVNIWNGVTVSNENGIYTVKNAGYNSDIKPGQSVTFGFNADAVTEKIIGPTKYNLVEMPLDDGTLCKSDECLK